MLKVGEWVEKSITFTSCAGSWTEHNLHKIPETLQAKEECEQPSVEKTLPKIWIVLATREANRETESHGEPRFIGLPAHRATYVFAVWFLNRWDTPSHVG